MTNQEKTLMAKKIIELDDSSSFEKGYKIKNFNDFQELVRDSMVFVKKTHYTVEDYLYLCDFYSQMRLSEKGEFEEYLNCSFSSGFNFSDTLL